MSSCVVAAKLICDNIHCTIYTVPCCMFVPGTTIRGVARGVQGSIT